MKLGWTVTLAVWAAATAAGFGYLGRAPRVTVSTPTFPADSSLNPAHLLVFAHPHCPCTRATLEELRGVIARIGDRVQTTVLFVRPPGAPEGWERTASWETATAIPGVAVRVDVDGLEARRFGAEVSGTTLFYDDRRLTFSGGITDVRGHPGQNPGRRALEDLLLGRTRSPATAPVNGCPLFQETER